MSVQRKSKYTINEQERTTFLRQSTVDADLLTSSNKSYVKKYLMGNKNRGRIDIVTSPVSKTHQEVKNFISDYKRDLQQHQPRQHLNELLKQNIHQKISNYEPRGFAEFQEESRHNSAGARPEVIQNQKIIQNALYSTKRPNERNNLSQKELINFQASPSKSYLNQVRGTHNPDPVKNQFFSQRSIGVTFPNKKAPKQEFKYQGLTNLEKSPKGFSIIQVNSTQKIKQYQDVVAQESINNQNQLNQQISSSLNEFDAQLTDIESSIQKFKTKRSPNNQEQQSDRNLQYNIKIEDLQDEKDDLLQIISQQDEKQRDIIQQNVQLKKSFQLLQSDVENVNQQTLNKVITQSKPLFERGIFQSNEFSNINKVHQNLINMILQQDDDLIDCESKIQNYQMEIEQQAESTIQQQQKQINDQVEAVNRMYQQSKSDNSYLQNQLTQIGEKYKESQNIYQSLLQDNNQNQSDRNSKQIQIDKLQNVRVQEMKLKFEKELNSQRENQQQLQVQLDDQVNLLQEAQNKIKTLEYKYADALSQLKQLSSQGDKKSLQKQENDGLKLKINLLQDELLKQDQLFTGLKEKIKFEQSQIYESQQSKQQELNDASVNQKISEDQIKQLNTTIQQSKSQTNKQISNLQLDIVDLNQVLIKKKLELQTNQVDRQNLKQQNDQLSENVKDLQSQIQEQDAINSVNKNNQTQIDKLETQLKDKNMAILQGNNIQSLQDEIQDLQNVNLAQEQQLLTLQQNSDDLNQEINLKEQELKNNQDEIKNLRDQFDQQSENFEDQQQQLKEYYEIKSLNQNYQNDILSLNKEKAISMRSISFKDEQQIELQKEHSKLVQLIKDYEIQIENKNLAFEKTNQNTQMDKVQIQSLKKQVTKLEEYIEDLKNENQGQILELQQSSQSRKSNESTNKKLLDEKDQFMNGFIQQTELQSAQIQTLQQEKNFLNQDLELKEQQSSTNQVNIRKLNKQINELQEKLQIQYSQHQEVMQNNKQKFGALENDNLFLKKQLDEIQRTIKNKNEQEILIQSENYQLTQSVKEIELQLENKNLIVFQSDLKSLQKEDENVNLRDKVTQQQDQIYDIKNQYQVQIKELQQSQQQKIIDESMNQKLLEEQIQSLNALILQIKQQFTSQISNLQQNIVDQKIDIAMKDAELQNNLEEIKNLEVEIEKLKENIEDQQLQLQQYSQFKSLNQDQMQINQQKVNELESDIESLKIDLDISGKNFKVKSEQQITLQQENYKVAQLIKDYELLQENQIMIIQKSDLENQQKQREIGNLKEKISQLQDQIQVSYNQYSGQISEQERSHAYEISIEIQNQKLQEEQIESLNAIISQISQQSKTKISNLLQENIDLSQNISLKDSESQDNQSDKIKQREQIDQLKENIAAQQVQLQEVNLIKSLNQDQIQSIRQQVETLQNINASLKTEVDVSAKLIQSKDEQQILLQYEQSKLDQLIKDYELQLENKNLIIKQSETNILQKEIQNTNLMQKIILSQDQILDLNNQNYQNSVQILELQQSSQLKMIDESMNQKQLDEKDQSVSAFLQQAELQSFQISTLQQEKVYSIKEFELKEQQLQTNQVNLRKLNKQIDELQEENQFQQSQLQEHTSNKSVYQEQMLNYRQKGDALENDNQFLKLQIDELTKNIKSKNEQEISIQSEYNKLIQQVKEYESQLENKNLIVFQSDLKNSQKEDEIVNLREKVTQLQDQIQDQKDQYSEQMSELQFSHQQKIIDESINQNLLEEQIQSLNALILKIKQQFNSQISNLQSHIVDQKTDIAMKEAELQNNLEEIKNLEVEIDKQRRNIEEQQLQLQQCSQFKSLNQDQMQINQLKVNELESNIESLKIDLDISGKNFKVKSEQQITLQQENYKVAQLIKDYELLQENQNKLIQKSDLENQQKLQENVNLREKIAQLQEQLQVSQNSYSVQVSELLKSHSQDVSVEVQVQKIKEEQIESLNAIISQITQQSKTKISNLQQENDELSENISLKESELYDNQEAHNKLMEQIDQLKENIVAQQVQLKESTLIKSLNQDQIQSISQQVETLQNNNFSLKTEIDEAVKLIKTKDEQQILLQYENSKLDQLIKDFDIKLENKNMAIQQSDTNNQQKEIQNTNLMQKIIQSQDQILDLNNQNSAQQLELLQSKQNMLDLKSDLELKEKEIQSFKDNIKEESQQSNVDKASIQDKDDQIVKFEEEIKLKEDKIKQLQNQLSTILVETQIQMDANTLLIQKLQMENQTLQNILETKSLNRSKLNESQQIAQFADFVDLSETQSQRDKDEMDELNDLLDQHHPDPLEKLKMDKQNLQVELKSLSDQNNLLTHEVGMLKDQLDDLLFLKNQNEKLMLQLDEASEDKNNLEKLYDELEQQALEVQEKADHLQNENVALNEINEQLQGQVDKFEKEQIKAGENLLKDEEIIKNQLITIQEKEKYLSKSEQLKDLMIQFLQCITDNKRDHGKVLLGILSNIIGAQLIQTEKVIEIVFPSRKDKEKKKEKEKEKEKDKGFIGGFFSKK